MAGACECFCLWLQAALALVVFIYTCGSIDFFPRQTRPLTRRRMILALSSIFPIVGLVVLLVRPKGGIHKAYVAGVFCIPGSITSLALIFIGRIRRSVLVERSLPLVSWGALVLSTFVNGFITLAGPSNLEAMVLSCAYIIWGWMVEEALGLKTPIGMVSTATALAFSFVKALAVQNKVMWAYSIVPLLVALLCYMASAKFKTKILPASPPRVAVHGQAVNRAGQVDAVELAVQVNAVELAARAQAAAGAAP